jgi:hypothetical protein
VPPLSTRLAERVGHAARHKDPSKPDAYHHDREHKHGGIGWGDVKYQELLHKRRCEDDASSKPDHRNGDASKTHREEDAIDCEELGKA